VHLDIIKVLLQLMHKRIALKGVLKFTLTLVCICYQVLAGVCLLHCSKPDWARFRTVQQTHTSKDLITNAATPPD